MTARPLDLANSMSLVLFKNGWTSICRTAGFTRAMASTSSIWASLKLDRPMERTKPASTSSSIAAHVSVNGVGSTSADVAHTDQHVG